MAKKVFIYSIPRETATRVDAFTDKTSGKQMKKTKIGGCKDTLMALYSPRHGGLANYISYTQYIDPETALPKVDEKGNPVYLQQYLEQKWGLPKDFLSNQPMRKATEDGTYFQTKSWKLNDGCTVLDLDNMDEELGYYVMLGSSKVANSEREWKAHKWPKATHYIALENESEELKYSRNEVKSKAFAALHDPILPDVTKRKFITLLNIASAKASLTAQQVHNLLFDYIDKSSFQPGSNIEKFMALVALLRTATGKEQIEARHILALAMDYRIVYEKQNTYIFPRPSGAITLGERYEEAIDFILSPKKVKEVEEMQKEIQAKQ